MLPDDIGILPSLRSLKASKSSCQGRGKCWLVVLHEGSAMRAMSFHVPFKAAMLVVSWAKTRHGLSNSTLGGQNGSVLLGGFSGTGGIHANCSILTLMMSSTEASQVGSEQSKFHDRRCLHSRSRTFSKRHWLASIESRHFSGILGRDGHRVTHS